MGSSQSEFAAAIDKIVADCNDRLLWVPYSKDKLSKQAARVLIQQWSSFTRHSRQCWAHVVGNCPIVEVRKFIVTENLYEEEAQEGHSHFEILARMGMALGLTRDEIVNAKPLPTTVVAMHAWEALTKNRTWYEGLAAKSVLERTNNPNCGNFSHHQAEHWMRQLGLSKEDTEFWWMHDSVDQIHGDGSLRLLESHLATDAEKNAALRAAEQSMMAWQVYFDGFYYEGLRRTAAKDYTLRDGSNRSTVQNVYEASHGNGIVVRSNGLNFLNDLNGLNASEASIKGSESWRNQR